MSEQSDFLERLTGHRFNDPALAELALTHRSAGGRHNERLEFLGDAVLGMVIAEALYQARPALPEGDLSRLRASLVNRESLARLAADTELGQQLRMGSGELKSGGFRRKSILADGLEAVIGALYLDAGFEPARHWVHQLFADHLADLPDPEELKDPKTRLQEYLQARGQDLPEYAIAEVHGQAHAQEFTAVCRHAGLARETLGRGRSRREAEQKAARKMFEVLRDE